jgi:RND superfamily putative drug exporter
LRTAGRTVAFSAVTVAVALAALLVFPMAYLRSYAYAGIAVVAFAALGAVTVLPALLSVLGERVGAARPQAAAGEGTWGRQARRVMRRPVLVTVAVTVVLLVLGVPFLHLRFGIIDDRVIPADFSSRAVNDTIRQAFVSREADAIGVVIPGLAGDDPASAKEIESIALKLAELPDLSRVDAATGHYLGPTFTLPADRASERFQTPKSTWLSIVPAEDAVSPRSEALVRAVRRLDLGRPVLVTGPTARFIDTKDSVSHRLLLALALVAIVTFVVLFAMLGSVVVPIKALIMNMLSLTATFGAMVWIFQDGHLASLLHVTTTGTIDVFTPILMFCVAFGLSMDYEVFLLSRIKEEYDLTGDSERAVRVGLDRTGRLVTAAAVLLALVFLGFMTSSVSIVKLVGLGLTVAVLVDAFLIRATLVPAVMRLAGRSNWWAPGPLRRLHLRYGIWEAEPSAEMDRLDRHKKAGSDA